MVLIYHAALENSLIICFMDSRPGNAPLPVFCRLVDVSKIKSTIVKNQLVATNRDSPKLNLLSHCVLLFLFFNVFKAILFHTGMSDDHY